MIKIIALHYRGNFEYELTFSDQTSGVFDGRLLLERTGPLLDMLREEKYFSRAFIDAGGLCWPNGLELSPSRLYEISVAEAA